MDKWSLRRDIFYKRLPQLGIKSNSLISSISGSVIISHSSVPSFNGTGKKQPYAFIGLCTKGQGLTQKSYKDGQIIQNMWSPGKIGFSLPSPSATGFSPEMDILGIAFKPDSINYTHGEELHIQEFESLDHKLFEDELISAVMFALLKDAEAHGAASAFFDHGLSLILNRLKKLTQIPYHYSPKLLPNNKLEKIYEYIDSALDEDIRVNQLATLLNVSPRSLTRLFKKHTGYTPFMYLTKRRMEKAKALLLADYSVTECSIAVGYVNPAKFSAAFKRWIGVTPLVWRQQNQETPRFY